MTNVLVVIDSVLVDECAIAEPAALFDFLVLWILFQNEKFAQSSNGELDGYVFENAYMVYEHLEFRIYIRFGSESLALLTHNDQMYHRGLAMFDERI